MRPELSPHPGRANGTESPPPLIQLHDVEKWFPQGGLKVAALRRISLTVRDGDFLTIMGPSAAGKSTLLHILGLQDHEWSGTYHFLGRPVHALGHPERERLRHESIGFVFQSYHLLDDLTVFENIELPLTYRGVSRSERDARVCETLDRFGLAARRHLSPSQLSGGQQQLVAIARAVVGRPRVILADEPTGNLHSQQAREIMDLFRRLNSEGATIVQVTHSEANAALGRRIVRLEDGWLANDQTRE